jgi:hypothetical protein
MALNNVQDVEIDQSDRRHNKKASTKLRRTSKGKNSVKKGFIVVEDKEYDK